MRPKIDQKSVGGIFIQFLWRSLLLPCKGEEKKVKKSCELTVQYVCYTFSSIKCCLFLLWFAADYSSEKKMFKDQCPMIVGNLYILGLSSVYSYFLCVNLFTSRQTIVLITWDVNKAELTDIVRRNCKCPPFYNKK